MNVFNRIKRILGIDFHIFTTLLFRFWSILAGVVTLLFIPTFLTGVEQGYYYAFASLLALQIFFELGMNQVILQIVSHEAAHLTRVKEFQMAGAAFHLDRLSYLVKKLRLWYSFASIGFLLVVGFAGILFFNRQVELSQSHWLGAWLLLVVATAGNLYWSPALALMEGCGSVGEVAKLRLVQSIIGYFFTWLGLVFGFGLWVTVLVPLVAFFCTSYWLTKINGLRVWLLTRKITDGSTRIDWRVEVFPFQWRIALSWISGYFIFQLFTPVVFQTQGAVQAGRLGVALNVFNAIVTVGMSWVNAKIPVMAGYISRNERSALNKIFFEVFWRSFFFVVLGVIAFIALVFWGSAVGIHYASKISSVQVLMCLGTVSIINIFVFSAAAYMRAHKEEPMLMPSLVTGIFVAMAVYFGARYSVEIMSLSYAVVSACIALPWTLILFRKYYERN